LDKKKNVSHIVHDFLYSFVHIVKSKFSNVFEVNCSYYTIEEVSEISKRAGFKIVKRKDNYFLMQSVV